LELLSIEDENEAEEEEEEEEEGEEENVLFDDTSRTGEHDIEDAERRLGVLSRPAMKGGTRYYR